MDNVTNEFVIRNLWTRRQLARALVHTIEEETTDYDWEENPIPGYKETYYVTSDGEEFSDYDEAVAYEEWWLRQTAHSLAMDDSTPS